MKTLFFISITIQLCFSAFAQNNISQLLIQLKNAPNDSARINTYKEIFEHYEYSNPDSAIYYLNDGLTLFSAKNYRPGIAYMITLLGYQDASQGRLALAKERENNALRIFEELDIKKGIGLARNGLGIIEGRSGNFNVATRYFLSALKVSQDIANTSGIINSYLNLGAVNEQSNNLDKALGYYNMALSIHDTPLTNSSVSLYNNIGIVYAKKGNLKKAVEYFQTALQKSDKPEYAGTHILALINLGIACQESEEDEKALAYLNEALQIAKNRNLPESHARVLTNISAITTKTNPAKAIEELKEALQIAKRIGQKPILDDIYTGLVEDYKKMGNYKDAVSLMQEQVDLEDSTFSIAKAKEIANLESVYELERSNARIKELKLEQQKNLLKRNISIMIAISLAIALIFISIYYNKTKRLNEILAKREAELKKSNTVKDKLFSMIGHDLRGPIANIPVMMKMLEDENTTTEERKYLLDSMTQQAQASMETLDKLLQWGKSQIKGRGLRPENFNTAEYLHNNIKLIKSIADQKQITIVNKVDTDTPVYGDPAHFDFIFRNLLSNAVKFTHVNGSVEINADKNLRQGFTVFIIKDDGVGIEKEQLQHIFEPLFSSSTRGTANERGTSMGLMLCKEFVMENDGDIWVESEHGKGSTFYFSFRNAQSS